MSYCRTYGDHENGCGRLSRRRTVGGCFWRCHDQRDSRRVLLTMSSPGLTDTLLLLTMTPFVLLTLAASAIAAPQVKTIKISSMYNDQIFDNVQWPLFSQCPKTKIFTRTTAMYDKLPFTIWPVMAAAMQCNAMCQFKNIFQSTKTHILPKGLNTYL